MEEMKLSKIPSGEAVGCILAGGLSTRMGYDKSSMKLDGRPVIETIESELSAVFEKVAFSIRKGTEERYKENSPARTLVEDIMPERGPIGGILSIMKAVESELYFVTACDMPFPNGAFAAQMIMKAQEGFDIVIPRMKSGHLHPLHAVYRKTCLPHIEEQLGRGDNKIINFFDSVKVCYVEEEEMLKVDSGLSFLENINTISDLNRITGGE